MENDPDIVRWSQIKKFIISFFIWMGVFGFFGWLADITQHSNNSTTSHIVIWVGLSVLMAFLIKSDS